MHLPKASSPLSAPNSRLSWLRALEGPSESHASLSQCSYQHPQPPGHLEWGRRHSEPRVALPRPRLGLTRRGSEPTYLPSVAVGWDWPGACWGMGPGLAGLASKAKEVGGSSWKSLSPSRKSTGALGGGGTSGIRNWGSCAVSEQGLYFFYPFPTSRFPARGETFLQLCGCLCSRSGVSWCLWSQSTYFQMPAPPLSSCVILDKSLNLSGRPCPHLQKDTDNTTCLTGS